MLGIRYLIVIVLLVGCSGEATTNDSAATSLVPTSPASVSVRRWGARVRARLQLRPDGAG